MWFYEKWLKMSGESNICESVSVDTDLAEDSQREWI